MITIERTRAILSAWAEHLASYQRPPNYDTLADACGIYNRGNLAAALEDLDDAGHFERGPHGRRRLVRNFEGLAVRVVVEVVE